MNIEELVKKYPNDMELGKNVRQLHFEEMKVKELSLEEMKGKMIFESPDGGKTVTVRPFGGDLSERVIIKSDDSFEHLLHNPSV